MLQKLQCTKEVDVTEKPKTSITLWGNSESCELSTTITKTIDDHEKKNGK